MVGREKIISPTLSPLHVQTTLPPFLLHFFLSFPHSRTFPLSPFLSFLPLLISFSVLHAHTHTQSKRETERNRRERVRERENCLSRRRRRRRRRKMGFWKLRPVGINGSVQQSSVVQSSWNFAERFTTHESPLWTVEIRFRAICSHFLSRKQ